MHRRQIVEERLGAGANMKASRYLLMIVAAASLGLAFPVLAQDNPQSAPPSAPAAPMPQDLLDSLLAPIALYPDQLLTQVLMASTYPLEVVEAARFVKANPNLRGAALDDALKDKTWDPSVLSLAAFPQVLDMMNDKLEWTQRLGDAFLSDEAGVMRTVQSLRQRAQQAGNLQSTQQQNVIVQDRTIVIEPAQPQYVYVPVYNPTVIYGPWWAPAYRPWFWYPPPIWGYPPYRGGAFAAGFVWGTAWAISANNWGWCRPNWSGGTVNININNNNAWVNRPQYRANYQNNGNWNHNVDHRRGVAYRDTTTANRYRPTNASSVQTRENYRGRDSASNASPATMNRATPGSTNNVARPPQGSFDRSAQGANNTATRPAQTQGANLQRSAPATMPASRPDSGARPMPAYQPESRPQVQRDANRGAQSREAMQRSAPVGGGGGNRAGGGVTRGAEGGGNRGGGGGGGQGRGR
jgi:hypothetical protein